MYCLHHYINFNQQIWAQHNFCHDNSLRDWHGNVHDNVNIFGLGGIDLLHYCCCCRASTETCYCQYIHNMLLWACKIYCCCKYNIHEITPYSRALECDQNGRICDHFLRVRVKIWRGRTCASAWSALLQSICFIQRALPAAAHCSRRKISLIRRFHHERFSRAWFTPVSHRTHKQSRGSTEAARMQSGSSARPLCFHSPRQHEREGARSGRSATEDLVFKLK